MALTDDDKRSLAATAGHRFGLDPDHLIAGANAVRDSDYFPADMPWTVALYLAAEAVSASRHFGRNRMAAAFAGADGGPDVV